MVSHLPPTRTRGSHPNPNHKSQPPTKANLTAPPPAPTKKIENNSLSARLCTLWHPGCAVQVMAAAIVKPRRRQVGPAAKKKTQSTSVQGCQGTNPLYIPLGRMNPKGLLMFIPLSQKGYTPIIRWVGDQGVCTSTRRFWPSFSRDTDKKPSTWRPLILSRGGSSW